MAFGIVIRSVAGLGSTLVMRAGAWVADRVKTPFRRTKGYEGITGGIAIDESIGNRVGVPVVILRVAADGSFLHPKWAAANNFGS